MSPDLYLVYRVADRIITTNNIKRPIRVAVRNNVDCVGMLGLDPNSAKCQSIQLLPQIDKATNFDIWAAQVVGTMSGSANAFAMSDAGTIFLNTAMLKELTGKIDQVACVVAHEIKDFVCRPIFCWKVVTVRTQHICLSTFQGK